MSLEKHGIVYMSQKVLIYDNTVSPCLEYSPSKKGQDEYSPLGIVDAPS